MKLPAVAIVAAFAGGTLLELEPLRAYAALSSLSVFVGVAVIFLLIPGFVLATPTKAGHGFSGRTGMARRKC
jgi:hypothetical protein